MSQNVAHRGKRGSEAPAFRRGERHDNSFWTKWGGAIVFAALSAIDQALWDIKAKALGVPVYELFGAKFSDSIEVYANGWNYGHIDAEEWARDAERPLSDGYKMLEILSTGYQAEGWKACTCQAKSHLL